MHLEGTYTVNFNGQPVGRAELRQQGLYWQINCCCHALKDRMFHLLLQQRDSLYDLGLLIPSARGLELSKRIPVKRTGEGEIAFFLRERTADPSRFYPVAQDAPFLWLHRLEECVFARRDGKIGIELPSENNGEKEKNNA